MKVDVTVDQKIVFCDFDGTITEKDAFVGVCQRFAPEMVADVLPKLMTKEISLRTGLTDILETIHSERYPAMLDSVQEGKYRPGFESFLNFLNENGIRIIVISGGLKGLVEKQLGKLKNQVAGIYAADVSTTDNYLKVVSTFQEGTELVAKAKIMEQYDYVEAVAIGDGITDFKMAEKADIVFARSQLAKHMKAINDDYYRWSDFNDIKNKLKELWDID